VGIGTLYRHFSTREGLLKAVYFDVTEQLAKAGQEFAETLPPVEALRAWMMLFVDFIAEKQIIAPALNALIDDPRTLIEASYTHTWETVRALIKRAIKSGDIREDLDAIDLLRALSITHNQERVRIRGFQALCGTFWIAPISFLRF